MIQDGVQPSLHIAYKNFDLKQYFKEGRGCRTEGTFRNAGDFGANKGLSNLPYLQKIGRQINRRLLEVERVSHNSGLSGDSIQRVVQPAVTEDGQKAPGLKFGQPRVMALLLALTMFHHLIDGFRNRHLRQQVADLLGVTLAEYTPHQMTYDLRRLRLKGLIYRPPKTNRYFVTPYGWKVARLFFAAGFPRLPASHGHVHRQRRRSTVPAPVSPGPRRHATRLAHLGRFSRSEGQLKNLTLSDTNQLR